MDNRRTAGLSAVRPTPAPPDVVLGVVRYDTSMQQPVELRPCPFCAHEQPRLTLLGDERVRFVLVMCPECGALGPRTTSDDPPGHAAHLWNLRYGAH